MSLYSKKESLRYWINKENERAHKLIMIRTDLESQLFDLQKNIELLNRDIDRIGKENRIKELEMKEIEDEIRKQQEKPGPSDSGTDSGNNSENGSGTN